MQVVSNCILDFYMAQPCMQSTCGAACFFADGAVVGVEGSDEEALHDDDVVVAAVVFDPRAQTSGAAEAAMSEEGE